MSSNSDLKGSLRIFFDLQATQTASSAQRGVGRASKTLFEKFYLSSNSENVFGVVSGSLGEGPDFQGVTQSRIVKIPQLPEFEAVPKDFQGGDRDSIENLLYSSVANKFKPDIIHVSHVFEGFNERVPLPSFQLRAPGQLYTATLHDLIPLRFPDHYLNNPDFKKWYEHRLLWLRQADLLLAVSESSRIDAIELLDIAPEKIVTMYWGVSEQFKPVEDKALARARVDERYKTVGKKLVLYTGGDDFRKNISGLLRSYARVDLTIRKNALLLIVCAMDEQRKAHFLEMGIAEGLSRDEVILTGFVPDELLCDLYTSCDLFVFPSLYEGFGLPIVEAMACGAPVIGGNNSSIKELIGREDALFDASNEQECASLISNILASAQLSDELREYSRERANEFTWSKTVERANDAFNCAVNAARSRGAVAARSGWLSRKRLAMLTPVPAARSGIADYNAEFLPYLSEFFELDIYTDKHSLKAGIDESLSASYRIFDVNTFERNADQYDAILYEFGASEFHAHMLDLLERYPGVVGLHDAYLGGMVGYMDFNLGQSGRYSRELLASHGTQARVYYAPSKNHPDPNFASMVDLPCTKGIIDGALGLISHSPFNFEVAKEFYPQGWLAPYRIISQMVVSPPKLPEEERGKLRSGLGFKPTDIVVATFGHITWTKLGNLLLEAFSQLTTDRDCDIYLVYAGELADDKFGHDLKKAVLNSIKKKLIRITGFLNDGDYSNYLRAADLAVQLRTNSRGGTPRGVLDCLSHGVPVVVNNDASYCDYPDDVVCKVSASPSSREISDTLKQLIDDPSQLSKLSKNGLNYISLHHNPRESAASYASAISEFMGRERFADDGLLAENLAPHLANIDNAEEICGKVSVFLGNAPKPIFNRKRIIIDVSHIVKMDHKTGIQRVVREIVRAAYCRPSPGIDFIAVYREGERLFEAKDWLSDQGLLLAIENSESLGSEIHFNSNDVLLLLDSSWEDYELFLPIFNQARSAGVPIIGVVYDILPLLLPLECFVPGGKEWFESRIKLIVEHSDSLLCISKATADSVIDYINSNNLGRPGINIGYWHLGADFKSVSDIDESVSEKVNSLPEPYCLMVGTLEPRKNHELALDAFEELWDSGSPLNLIIVGKFGWNTEQLIERIRSHPKLNSRLFYFDNLVDSELSNLYSRATASLLLSKGEGFGLPLIEAAHFETPVICSDISVFREIGGENASYVSIESPTILSNCISSWWVQFQSGETPDPSGISYLSWAESLESLLNVVQNDKWHWIKP